MAAAAGTSSKTPVSGSTTSGSVMVISTAGTAVLTNDYSKLFGETPSSTAAPLFPSISTSLSPSLSPSLPLTSLTVEQTIIPTSTTSPTEMPTTSVDGLSNTQLGAVIGGAAGGVLVLVCLIGCILYLRKNKNKSFQRGRGITPSMVFENPSFQPQSMQYMDRPFDQQSTYSFNSPQNAFGSSPTNSLHVDQREFTPTTPSENVTATLDKLYSIKQYNTPGVPRTTRIMTAATGTSNQRALSQASANGARLSKYNYLTEAFSQMRASYAAQDPSPHNTLYDGTHQVSTTPSDIQYPNRVATSESTTMTHKSSSPTRLAGSTGLGGPAVNVLHAPLFQRNDMTSPSPTPTFVSTPSSTDAPSITVFDENNKGKVLHKGHMLDTTVLSSTSAQSEANVSSKKLRFPGTTSSNQRDSTLSEVSQYSTFSSSSNPFRYSDDHDYGNSPSSASTPENEYSPTTTSSSNNNTYQPSPLSEKPYAYI